MIRTRRLLLDAFESNKELASNRNNAAAVAALLTVESVQSFQVAWLALDEFCRVHFPCEKIESKGEVLLKSSPLSDVLTAHFFSCWDSLQVLFRQTLVEGTNAALCRVLVMAITSALSCLGFLKDFPQQYCQETVMTATKILNRVEVELVPSPAELHPPTFSIDFGSIVAFISLREAVLQGICPSIVDPLLGLVEDPDRVVGRHLKAYTHTILSQIVLPEYCSNKWSASSRFMGGRYTSHSIVFLHMTLMRQLQLLQENGILSALAGELIFCLVSEFHHVFKHMKCSEARSHQLRGDVLYFVRNVRSLRAFYSNSGYGSLIDDCLLCCVAAVSLRTSSITAVAKWRAGGNLHSSAMDSDEVKDRRSSSSFEDQCWKTQTVSRSVLAQSAPGPLGQSQNLLSPTKAQLPHEDFVKIGLPLPFEAIDYFTMRSSVEKPNKGAIASLLAEAGKGNGSSLAGSVVFDEAKAAPSHSTPASTESIDAILRSRWELWDSYPPIEDADQPAVDQLKEIVWK